VTSRRTDRRLERAHVGQRAHLGDDAAQLVGESARTELAEDGDEGPVVPELIVGTGVETGPHVGPLDAQVGDGGASVVELVGGGDEAHLRWSVTQVGEVGFLARAPRRLRGDVGVRAGRDDGGDGGAEAAANGGERAGAALVFDGVVEQGRDREILAAAVLEHQGGDGEEVGDVGDA
jgi:hypothetical protein